MNQTALEKNLTIIIKEIASAASEEFTGKLSLDIHFNQGGIGRISSYKAKNLTNMLKKEKN